MNNIIGEISKKSCKLRNSGYIKQSVFSNESQLS